MANSTTLVKLSCAIVLCIMIVAPHGEALITCGQVAKGVSTCIAYLTTAPAPSPACCSGLRSLVGLAMTKADRQAACRCLKTQSGSIKGLDFGKAASLPGKCGVKVPYVIGPNTNCDTVN